MQEKMKDIKRELIEKGKKKGVLTFKEISDAFEDIEVTPEEIERLYDVFEKESIELVEDLDKELEEIEVSKEELEDLSVPEGINIDDHVKMYLKEIGKVNLLTPEEELSLAKRMAGLCYRRKGAAAFRYHPRGKSERCGNKKIYRSIFP